VRITRARIEKGELVTDEAEIIILSEEEDELLGPMYEADGYKRVEGPIKAA
jgi:hypothetical protein